ncbi:MAG: hypothetical protein IJD57_05610 [Candidatus Gastranaerophilales bacterium]|nr:hypothetical protein [Candidatus Gastranaerophilales bacterium]
MLKIKIENDIQFIKELANDLPEIIEQLEKEVNNNHPQHLTLLKLNDTICDLYEETIRLIRFLNKFSDNINKIED